MNAQIFEINEPKNWSIPEIYEQAARDVGYPTTPKTKFDCRKILVSEDIQDKAFDYLRSNGYDEASIGMMWCCAGPKVEKQLPKGHVCVMDGFFMEELSFDGVKQCQDVFTNETRFWVAISNLPEKIQKEAQEIDGENYNPKRFGLCVVFNKEPHKYHLMERESAEGPAFNAFYTDRDGVKHWFYTDIADDFLQEVFAACSAAITPSDVKAVLGTANESTFENIASAFVKLVNEDDEPYNKVGRSMLEAYSCNDVSAFCVAVTGWTFENILKKAGAIEDYGHAFED